MHRYLLFILFLCSFLPDAPAQAHPATSALGIFNATADWGLNPEETIGLKKAPGRVKVSGEREELVYDLYGNGDDIWGNQDEGFYVYTEVSGSFSLSGKVRWIETGKDNNNWQKICLMIREEAGDPFSKTFFATQHVVPGTNIDAQWRPEKRDITLSSSLKISRGLLLNQSTYLRVTRFFPENFFVAEYSPDGRIWHEFHRIRIEMKDTVSVGLAISNHEDNEKLAHAQVSEVHLSHYVVHPKDFGVIVTRSLSAQRYQPGEAYVVALEIQNSNNRDQEVLIQEIPPLGWQIDSISHNGRIHDSTIAWSLSIAPGSTQVSYTAIPPQNYTGIASFSGRVGSESIQGTQRMWDRLGLFDRVADWGAPDSPPLLGLYKVSGNVIVSSSEENPIYDLYGNGNDIYGSQDEGLYVFTQKSGSWTLSARLQWREDGVQPTDRVQPKVGPMIREQGSFSASKHYSAFLFGKKLMAVSETKWRPVDGEESFYKLHLNPDGSDIAAVGESAYLRVTRIAPYHYFYSEWSRDGIHWTMTHDVNIEMATEVAYGIAITNEGDNDLLSHAQVSQVILRPAPVVAIRSFSRNFYSKAEDVQVQLEVLNSQDSLPVMKIQEQVPTGWSILKVNENGTISGNVITWTLPKGTAIAHISYQVRPADNFTGTAVFSNPASSIQVIGQTRMEERLTEVYIPQNPNWRSWSLGEDFQSRLQDFFCFPDGSGLLHTQDHRLLYLDGYRQSELASLGAKPVQIRKDADGLLWAACQAGSRETSVTNLLCYKDQHWVSTFTSTSLAAHATPDNQSFLIDFYPLEQNWMLLMYPHQLLLINLQSSESRVIKEIPVEDQDQKSFYNIYKTGRNGFWIVEQTAIDRLEIDFSSTGLTWNWKERPVEEKWIGYFGFMRNSGIVDSQENLWLVSNTEHQHRLFRYDGHELYLEQEEGDFIRSGFRDSDGILWLALRDSLVTVDRHQSRDPNKESIFSSGILNISLERSGTLWIATGDGVARKAPFSWRTPVEVSGIEKPVYSIHEDPQGRLWFLYSDKLIGLKQGKWAIYDIPKDNESGLVDPSTIQPSVISTAHPFLILSGFGNRLIFNPEEESFSSLNYPEIYFFNGVYPNPRNHLWITGCFYASYTSLWEYDGDNFRRFIQGPITSIYETGSQDLWVSYETEIRRYPHLNRKTVRDDNSALDPSVDSASHKPGDYVRFTEEQGYTPSRAYVIQEVTPDRIWVGKEDGLFEFTGQRWTRLRGDIGVVRTIQPGRDGSVWVGSSTGLYCFRNESWHRITTEDGLKHDSVYSLLEDSQGHLWAGTAFGISRYVPGTDRDPPITLISEADNISQKEIAPSGRVQIAYSGMDKWKYTDTHRLLYSHRLDWGERSPYTSHTVFSATDLPAGNHMLEVRTMDRNGNVDPYPAVFEFAVLRAWYREPGFLLMSTCGSLLTIVFALYAFNRHTKLVYAYDYIQKHNQDLHSANEQLHEANEKLLELDKMKSAFVSQASHDLRSPLTAIKISLDNLLLGIAGAVNEKQKKVIERATKSVDRLASLVNDVLDLSRIESGKMVLEKSPVSLASLTEAVLQECKPTAEQKQITLHYTAPMNLILLLLDRGKMLRVIEELVSNAVKYTPENGQVEVTLTQSDSQVSLAVQDSGIGMTKEECGKIWERFYRTPQSQRMAKGSGLGLSIAKELVEMHGGRMEVESEKEKGSTFWMILPAPAVVEDSEDRETLGNRTKILPKIEEVLCSTSVSITEAGIDNGTCGLK